MKWVVLGATGGTGRQVVAQALEAGHQVTAVVRSAARVPGHPHLQVLEGRLDDPDLLDDALAGARAVISALGLRRKEKDDPPSRALPAVLEAMRRARITRYVGLSHGAVTLPGERKNLTGKLLSTAVELFRPAVVADKVRELGTLLEARDIEWTLVRPPRLVDGPRTGKYQVSLAHMPGTKIARADVADFLLAQVEDRTYLSQAPYIAK